MTTLPALLALFVQAREGPPLGEAAASPGLAVHVGTVDGRMELDLAARGFRLVHGLALSAEAAERARKEIAARGPYGAASVEAVRDARALPHADHLVNLLVADLEALGEKGPSRAEIERVLVPGGSALLREKGAWTRLVKPRPAEMDEWTHPHYGPDERRSSADRAAGVPAGLQWAAGPIFPLAERKSSAESLVSAGGRLFAITQNDPANLEADPKERPNRLVARDAFNGLLLWERPSRGKHLGKSGAVNPRLVADARRLYVVEDGRLAALDAATGAPLLAYPTPAFPEKFLLLEGLLVVETKGGLAAFAAETAERRWEHPTPRPPEETAAGGSVVCFFDSEPGEGRVLAALDLAGGKPLWRRRLQEPGATPFSKGHLEIAFLDGEKLGLVGRERLLVLSPSDGRELWSRKLSDNRYRQAYLAGGLVWAADKNDVVGLDPASGKEARKIPVPGKLDTCQPHFATHEFVIDPRHPAAVDLATGKKMEFGFARGGCGVGFVAANGLLYTTPNACACYKDALRGLLALTPARRAPAPEEEPRLESGPAEARPAAEPAEDEWPTYRRDPARSARSPRDVPAGLRELWRTRAGAGAGPEWELRAGAPLTAPVVAGGRVFVAVPDAHRLAAFDADTGRPAWDFTAGGRIDAPPTVAGGLCLFGSRDGWVYALRASDGRQAWRFRAAPADRRIVAFGRLESVWPALGSVLVRDGVAYAAAGRAPGADGGIRVHALEPQTGRPLWSRSVSTEEKGGLCDLLVAGEEGLCVSGRLLDWKSGEERPLPKNAKVLRGGPGGLLEASWTRIPLGLRKDVQTWTYGGARGQLLAWSPARVFGYDTHSSGRSPRKSDDDALFADGPKGWKAELPAPMQVEAMILAGDVLWSAGALDRERRRAGGGFLRGLSEGRSLQEIRLEAPPAYDGLAAAYGRLFLATEDGFLVCLGSEDR